MLGVQRFVLDRIGNPVLEWDLLQRRKHRAYVVGMRIVYGLYSLFVFTSTALLLLWDPWTEHRSNALLEILGWLPVCVIFLVVPVFGAFSVVGERRSQTLELVQLSLLRPFDIVWAKVVASITPILVFVFGLLPLALLSFFPGNNMYRLVRDGEYQFVMDGEYWFLFLLADNAVFLAVVVLAMVTVLTVSALSVLVSTFAKSSPAAVIVSYGMAFMFFVYLVFLIPDSYFSGYYHSWSTKTTVVYCVFVVAVLLCAAGLFVWWACKRLRLPVVSTSAKSSAATIPMSRVAVPVSLFVTLILLLLSASLFVLLKAVLLVPLPGLAPSWI